MAQAKRGAEMWIVKERNQRCSVQRLGHKDGDPAFSLRGYKQATALVERLNRLDRAEVALDVISAMVVEESPIKDIIKAYRVAAFEVKP
jgi:hypothetical protein